MYVDNISHYICYTFRFTENEGWDLIYQWLQEAKTDENTPFVLEILKLYGKLPVTIELLKRNNCAKTIKQLGKSEDESK